MAMKHTGTVYLVGAGPGDAGLMTLRGAELLARAEVVVYDALINADFLGLAPPSAEIIYAGKRYGEHAVPQEVSTGCWWTRPAPADASSGSKAATLMFLDAAARKPWRWRRRKSPLKWSPVFPPFTPPPTTPAFPSPTAIIVPASPFSPATKTRRKSNRARIGRKRPKRPAPKSFSWE